MTDKVWAELKSAFTDHLDELVMRIVQHGCTTAWCQEHEDDGGAGWCRTRMITVGKANLEILDGTDDRSLKLFGLDDFGSAGIDLDTAVELVAALTGLLREVGR